MPMSPLAFAYPALPLQGPSKLSQSFTASRQTSQLSQRPPLGGATSLIQTSNGFLPKTSTDSIAFFKSVRISDKVDALGSANGNRSFHRLEIRMRILFAGAMGSNRFTVHRSEFIDKLLIASSSSAAQGFLQNGKFRMAFSG